MNLLKNIRFFIAIVCVAFVLLIGFQAYFIVGSYQLQKRILKQNMQQLTERVAERLHKQQAVKFLTTKANPLSLEGNYEVAEDTQNIKITRTKDKVSGLKKIMHSEGNPKRHIKIEINNNGAIERSSKIIVLNNDSNEGNWMDSKEVRVVQTYFDTVKKDSALNIFTDLAAEFQLLDGAIIRYDSVLVDSLIEEECVLMQVDLQCKSCFVKPIDKKDGAQFVYASLNPGGFLGTQQLLQLQILNQREFLLGKILIVILSSGLITLIFIILFLMAITAMIKQKKLDAMKTDFINNLTHELKTPVSTIMLASEALSDPAIELKRDKIQSIAAIIQSENNRLNTHIERVLTIAQLDKTEFNMSLSLVNAERIWLEVYESFALKLKHHQAKLKVDWLAEDAIINTDAFHFFHVLQNVLDNALKYHQPDHTPDIEVKAYSTPTHLHIDISDNGIGMSPEQIAKIFDQFYRVPTGNIHNVKGFGLGLSYVYSILKKSGGSIKVQSTLGKGSTFTIIMPLGQS